MSSSLEEKNIHVGHRQRMRSKLLIHGSRIFDTYELLEMLLYYVIPYKDTNPTAKLLLKRFNSLPGVFGADADELTEVTGVGGRVAEYIHDLGELMTYIGGELPHESDMRLDSYDKVGNYFVNYFDSKTESSVVIMLLDNSMHLIATETLYDGVDYDSSAIKPEPFVTAVTKHRAALAITAHNHVYGPCYPTSGDRATDALITRSLTSVGIKHLEHYIVSGSQYIGVSKTSISGLVGRSDFSEFSKSEHACAEFDSGVFSRHSRRISELLCKLLVPVIKEGSQECVCELIKKYGTVSNVFCTDAYVLSAEVGDNAALAIKLYAYLYGRSVTDSFVFGERTSRASVAAYFQGLYAGASVETVYVMLLDSEKRSISCEYVGEGTVNTSEILPRKIISQAMSAGASSVIIAHNHPLGIAEPSEDDVQLTASLATALSLVGKRLEYHVVVADHSAFIIDHIDLGLDS